MPLPLLPLAVKGLIVIGKAIVAHGSVVPITKTSFVLIKTAVSTYGLSTTVGGALTLGIVVGGVAWVKERVDSLQLALKALEDDDIEGAVKHFADLAVKLGTTVSVLPHAVSDYLETINVASEKVQDISELISCLKDDISYEISRLT